MWRTVVMTSKSKVRRGDVFLALMLLSSLLLPSCGFVEKEKSNKRRALAVAGDASDIEDVKPVESAVPEVPTPSKPVAVPVVTPGPQAGGGSNPVSTIQPEKEYDESFARSTGASYFQRDPALKDLFTNDQSLLCWPTAMAYQLDYQKNYRRPAYEKLRVLTDDVSVKKVSIVDQIRYLTNLCGVNTKVGTYPSQATDCISKFYQTSGYQAEISAIGPVVAGEHFADDVGLFDRAITVSDLRHHLKANSAIIAMVGYYTQSASDSTWHRLSGHFVSIMGYDYKKIWGDKKVSLHMVNPDIDYSRRDPEDRFDLAKVTAISAAEAKDFPAGMTLLVSGNGFDQFPAVGVLERLIVFKVK
jgi:hypothetical protein